MSPYSKEVSASPSQPLISVCIPAYNADEFLRETLASVAAQTYPHWEIVLTEDGSSDDAQTIVAAFAATVAQRVVYLRHEKNLGLSATRNTSIAEARGKWVAVLDADDLWEPSHLADLVAATIATPGCAIACAMGLSFDSRTGAILDRLPHSDALLAQFPVSLFTGELIIYASSVLIRRSAFQAYGLVNERYRICNDTELFLRFASRGARFAFTRKPTLRYRRHAAAMTAGKFKSLLELASLYHEYADWTAIPFLIRKRKASSLYRYAGKAVMETNPPQARTYFFVSLRHCSWDFATWYFLGRSFLQLLSRRRTLSLAGGSRPAT